MSMKNPGYKETYLKLVTQGNIESLRKIIKEHEYYDPATVDEIQYRDSGKFPYLFLIVNSSQYINGEYAMLDGIYLDIKTIIPYWHGKFYLSIMLVREVKNKKIKPFVNCIQNIEHELHHLHQIIGYIDNDPGYIERSMKYNVGSCLIDDLDKSIEFEVNKIFSMEIPAMGFDFDMGEKDILSYENGTITKITVNEKTEFLRYKAALCLSSLNNRYFEKFPENRELIKANIVKQVNHHGRSLFGNNCMNLLSVTLLQYFAKLNTEGVCCEVNEI